MTDITQELQRIVELGKAATARPWEWWTSNSHRRLSSQTKDGGVAWAQAGSRGNCSDIVISEADMSYSAAAANLADIMAQELIDNRQRLLAIGKLCEDCAYLDSDGFYCVSTSSVRAILEGP